MCVAKELLMIDSITRNLLWSQGRSILCVMAGMSLIAWWYIPYALYGIVAFFIFTVYFFRYPHRVCLEAQQDHNSIVCPADGVVMGVVSEVNLLGQSVTRVSIFLSPLDVHVNWVPFEGYIAAMDYIPGSFACAFLTDRSQHNEQHRVTFCDAKKRSIIVTQIAGLVARRICWWVTLGQKVNMGDTFGMIRFGSRVDIVIPLGVLIFVKEKQRVYGGKTLLGRWV